MKRKKTMKEMISEPPVAISPSLPAIPKQSVCCVLCFRLDAA